MAKDLASVASSWANSAAGAQQKFVDGVQNTTKDPVARAIAAQPAMLANYSQSITSGRWQQRIAAVGKAGWQQATIAKAQNYSTGIQAGRGNYESAMQTWLPIINQAAATVNAMPSGSLAANLARANAFATALYNRKRGLA
jgi:hypothetical protein